MDYVKYTIKYIKIKKKKLDLLEDNPIDLRIGDLVNCWIKRYLRNSVIRQGYLYNYILEFKKIKSNQKQKFLLKDQIQLEKILKKMQSINAFKLISYKNKKIRAWYGLMVTTLKSKLKFNDILNKRYIEKFVMCFFKSLVYCIQSKNDFLSTLVCQLERNISLILNTYDDFNLKIKQANNSNDSDISILKNKIIIKVRNELFTSAVQNDLISVATESLSKLKEEQPTIDLKNYQNKYSDKVVKFSLSKAVAFYMECYVQTVDFKPPMFIKPKKWKVKKKDKKLYYEGGYFNNLYLGSNFDKEKRVELNKSYFTAINYLQEVPLKVNKKYLNYLLRLNVSHLLKEFPVLELESLKSFMIKSKYKTVEVGQLSLLNEICFILYFANLFKDLKLYYPHIHDWRGRTYPNCYPLHFYTKDIWKGLFMFYRNKKKQFKWNDEHLNFLRKNSKNPEEFDEKYKFENTFYSEKDFYVYKSIYYARSLAMIGLDASSSSFQIQGLLILDNDMLKHTNVFSNEIKQDIYRYTSNHLLQNFNINNFKKSFSVENKNEKIQLAAKLPLWSRINITNSLKDELDFSKILFESEEDFLNFYKNNIIGNRELIKQIIMRLGYNQKLNSRIDETYNYIKVNFLKNLNDYNFFFQEFIFNFCYQIENSFFELFMKQALIRKFFIKSVEKIYKNSSKKLDNPPHIIFSLFKGSHKVYQLYYTHDSNSIWIRMPKSSKRFHLRYLIPSKIVSVDKMKTQLATLPNYIQYLDSCILIEFVNLIRKFKINLKTIHDNFITDWDNINKINDFYIYAMQTVLLRKPHPLYTFLEDNNLLGDKELIKLFNEITNFGIDIKILNNLLTTNVWKSDELFDKSINSNKIIDFIYQDIKLKMADNKYILNF